MDNTQFEQQVLQILEEQNKLLLSLSISQAQTERWLALLEHTHNKYYLSAHSLLESEMHLSRRKEEIEILTSKIHSLFSTLT